jgi:hypothetical protein
MQPPPSSPPQWSPDGQWWWDGTRWRPRIETAPPPAPAYPMPPQPYYPAGYAMPGPAPNFPMPPPVVIKPSPGLRIVLIISLSLAALMAGFLLFVAIFGTVSDSSSGISISGDIVFLVITLALFVVTVVALIGSVIRARWSRWVAIGAGIALTLTCAGALVGIPILVTAARAPDLTRKPA